MIDESFAAKEPIQKEAEMVDVTPVTMKQKDCLGMEVPQDRLNPGLSLIHI